MDETYRMKNDKKLPKNATITTVDCFERLTCHDGFPSQSKFVHVKMYIENSRTAKKQLMFVLESISFTKTTKNIKKT